MKRRHLGFDRNDRQAATQPHFCLLIISRPKSGQTESDRCSRFKTRPRHQRSAFTLLETMLALSLSALLLAGIYAAIDQSWRASASGREEMERAQLARALIHKIEVDIRSITFVPPPPVAPTEDAPAANPPAGGQAAATTTDTETPVPNSKSLGVRGTNQKLEISISRPRRDLLPGTQTSTVATQTSDLRQVSYTFLPSGSGSASGLVRTEGDRMAVEVAEADGGSAAQMSQIQVLAPEVTAFYLRYFDGRVWSESWDTDTMARIPRAIEVSFSFPPAKRPRSMFSTAVSSSMNKFRMVILIPVSDPYPKDFVQ